VTDDPASREGFQGALLNDDPQALYDQAPCGYLSTTPEGVVVKVNETFLAWTAYSREDLLRKRTFTSLLTTGGQIYHDTHVRPMLFMQDGVREIALEVVKRNGERMPVLVNAALVRARDGEPAVIRIAIFDATVRRRYEQELLHAKRRAEESEARARSLAATLQQTLVPPQLPHIPGLTIAAAYRSAIRGEEIGGDFYDVFQIGEGDWVVALGDVSGKGVDAAVLTSLVRYTLRAVTVRVTSPAAALRALNEVLLRHETQRFCTAVLMRLRLVPGAWQVTLSLGGHPQPLRLTADGGVGPVGQAGTLVGLLADVQFVDDQFELEPGTTLLLYTDGVPEARADGHFYGDDRLREVAAEHVGAPQALVDALLQDVLDFQLGRPRDDIALMALQALPGRG
jgi:sigma-B regulation protein RsbU (phosphoserine phosphatase)